ncbi:MAG: DUF2332 domain-containing protein, partial [Reyranella sp.]|uniref:DUF2332 domain-containing protein n=1 Tax=Reyranella sp. TaxID=1929291 RepID=UPI003D0DAAC8
AEEARGASPSYERLTLEIAESREILDFLLGLPSARRQPNLLLAASRIVAGRVPDKDRLIALIREPEARLRTLMLSRTTQTNEPARCAVLLPVLASLPPPLALIEVGASGGLCLLPDRYGYDYGARRIAGAPGSPTFPCAVQGPAPLPADAPQIVWRAGLDLSPIDIGSAADTAWLEALVWPEQENRRRRLLQSIAVARAEPPRVVRGDLLHDLDALIDEAPADATLVVFHSAALAYVTPHAARLRFAEALRRTRAIWISNEAPGVFPDIIAQAPTPTPSSRFLLAVDGVPKAWTGPHGQSLEWFA